MAEGSRWNKCGHHEVSIASRVVVGATRCYCFLRNASDKVQPEQKTPYEMRNGIFFMDDIPFGAFLPYKPTAKRDIGAAKKFDGKMRRGNMVR